MRTRPCLALILVVALFVAGCGGGESTSTVATGSREGYPKGPTRQFLTPGSDNTVQEFGREAAPAERMQASKTVAAWLLARVRGDWAEACSYMHAKIAAQAGRLGSTVTGKHITGCPQGLAAVTRGGETPRDNLKSGVASLRIQAGRGYAQYHGKEGRDWVLAVRREHGTWKIADFFPIERFR
jgi:hypothetical protein